MMSHSKFSARLKGCFGPYVIIATGKVMTQEGIKRAEDFQQPIRNQMESLMADY